MHHKESIRQAPNVHSLQQVPPPQRINHIEQRQSMERMSTHGVQRAQEDVLLPAGIGAVSASVYSVGDRKSIIWRSLILVRWTRTTYLVVRAAHSAIVCWISGAARGAGGR